MTFIVQDAQEGFPDIEHDYIIVCWDKEAWLVGHKCIKTKRAWFNPFYASAATSYYRWQTSKHCKVCHKTWPKEVQKTFELLK